MFDYFKYETLFMVDFSSCWLGAGLKFRNICTNFRSDFSTKLGCFSLDGIVSPLGRPYQEINSTGGRKLLLFKLSIINLSRLNLFTSSFLTVNSLLSISAIVYENDLERQEEEPQSRPLSCKIYFSSQKERGCGISKWVLSSFSKSKGEGVDKYFQSCKILLM